MATEWSLDFCLVCDRQTLGGAYCSQPCRLAELDNSSPADSEPSSPTTSSSAAAWRGGGDTTSGLHLAPAFDFAAYKSFSSSSSRHYGSLTPSSSETSLSSMGSNATSSSRSSSVSDKARNELRDYASSFDHVRDWKRRLTTS